MTDPLKQKTHAEKLIEVTKEYTLRPKSGDRVDVCIAVLQYLLDNFAYDFDYDVNGWGNSIKCVETEDIENLICQLQKTKMTEHEEYDEISNTEEFSDPCPDCGKELEDAPGGGVKCSCGYWFCY